MILFLCLLLTLLFLVVFAIACIGIGGAAFILLFGDVIVCVWLIIVIIKKFIKKK